MSVLLDLTGSRLLSHSLCELSLLLMEPLLDELVRGEQPWVEWRGFML